PDGFKGIGPKTALKLLQENQSIEKIAETRANFKPPSNLDRIRDIFLKPSVTSNFSLRWNRPRTDALVSFLCGDRDFSEERVRTAVERATIASESESSKQTLEAFFGKS
ncbi:MAG TPA: flap structure-specific endonuclease, partial [Candidatus Bathyarchaeia archaeon]|nr:flap structure-specific endonuclease [Candidatus Bathyarchaeia archaeon]